MEVVTGFSDWEFLKPENDLSNVMKTVSTDEKKKRRNVSLEDFDGELAVFQVCQVTCTCTYCTYRLIQYMTMYMYINLCY